MNHITTTVVPRIPADSPSRKIDVIVGLDARGFLIGPPLALRLGAAFVPVRKKGKLPGPCVQAVFEKEYGEASIFFLFFICFAPMSGCSNLGALGTS